MQLHDKGKTLISLNNIAQVQASSPRESRFESEFRLTVSYIGACHMAYDYKDRNLLMADNGAIAEWLEKKEI